MYRRRFVAALGATAAGGCLGEGPGNADAGGSGQTPTGTLGDGDPTAPSFPPDSEDVDRVVWARDVDDPSDRLVLEPDAKSGTLPRTTLSFTLRNGTDETFQTNFHDWALYRREDGVWYYLVPRVVVQPLMGVRPGGSHEWMLTVDNTDLSSPSLRGGDGDGPFVRGLGSGEYAFTANGWWAEQNATPTHEHKTVVAARFSLEGDPLALGPSDAVSEVSRDGDVITVTATNPAAEDLEDDRPATFVLTRDPSATGAQRMVTEQVYRRWPLRDALALADRDVREVRIESTEAGLVSFGFDDGPSAITYEGQHYRIDRHVGDQ